MMQSSSIKTEVPIKPGIFKCPDEFQKMSEEENVFPISGSDEENEDYEFVLIRTPHDLDFALLEDVEIPIEGTHFLNVGKDKTTSKLCIESRKTNINTQLTNLTLMVPSNDRLVPANKNFTHYVDIKKDVSVPPIIIPSPKTSLIEFPSGLKQRYKAFGSDDPVVSVGEKHVKRSKHKLKKKDENESQSSMQLDNDSTCDASTSKIKRENKWKYTEQYITQLDISQTVEKKKKKKELQKLLNEEVIIKKPEKKTKKVHDKEGHEEKIKKHKLPKSKKNPTEGEKSREDLIQMIMGNSPKTPGRVRSLKHESLKSFSQEF